MRVAIIGTSGQLATELRRRPLPPGLELIPAVKLDIADEALLSRQLDEWRPQVVLNAAAYTAVDRAEDPSERDRAFAVNEAGPRHLAKWCARNGAALVHVSTDYVFDGTKAGAYTESDATAPLGVYGQSKLAGEEAIRAFCPAHVILRTSWVVSPHGHNFLKTMMRLAREREELRVVADQHGRPTAASDLADAVLLAASYIQRGEPRFGTFHFANSEPSTWHGLAEAIVEAQARFTGKRPRVTPIATHEYPTPARRPANSVLDTTAFERAFAMKPRSWRAAVAEIVAELSRDGTK